VLNTFYNLVDTWALPGGHLEFGESFETCSEREILEETGLQIRDIRFLTATNSVFEAEGKHYVTIFMTAVLSNDSDQPEVGDPAYTISSSLISPG
jgi:8-oxo-dGTP diphosphatase